MRKSAEPPGRKYSKADSASAAPPTSFPIIGIGSSAGGLEACITLLKSAKPDLGMAFVFVPHLAFLGDSIYRQLLGMATSMPAVDAVDGMTVQPDHVYVIPPRYDMTISDGKLRLTQLTKARSLNKTVDIFLRSLAADQRQDAIGIILSGMASDGTLGLAAVKAGGGTTFVQDASAKFASMPNSAIAAGGVDLILSPQGMAAELAHMGQLPKAAPGRSKRQHGIERIAASRLPEEMQPAQARESAEHTEVGNYQASNSLRIVKGLPAFVIAIVKSPRELLTIQAQRLMAEANQARLRFVELELMLASTLCDAAEADARMGDSASVLNVLGKIRKAVASAQHRMAQAEVSPQAFRQLVDARIKHITDRIQQLEQ